MDKKLGLQKNTTEARLKACNDVRIVVSFCAMNHLKETVVLPELNFNVNFTEYNATISDWTETKVKICGGVPMSASLNTNTPGCTYPLSIINCVLYQIVRSNKF